MPQVNVIRWRDGAGWIILAGSADASQMPEIDAQALSKIYHGEPVAYIWAAGDVEQADQHLLSLDDLGAPTGYLIDVLTEDDATIKRQLTDVGMIILGDGPDLNTLHSGILGAALEGMIEAHIRGSAILGIGAGARVLGAFLENSQGLNWIDNAAITSNSTPEQIHALMSAHPGSYGIDLGTGAALALGPDGEVESWGTQKITIRLWQAGHD